MATKNLLSGGCVDVLVVQQQDKRLKSTAFQIVFGYFKFNAQTKSKQVKVYINGTLSNVTMYIDSSEGRAKFLKKIPKRQNRLTSDSQQNSDDDRQQRSKSRQRNFSPNTKDMTQTKLKAKMKEIEQLKNQQRPNFWYFSWFQKQQKNKNHIIQKQIPKPQQIDAKLQKIDEQVYQGEQGPDPQILLSLCKHLLKKNASPKQNLKIFYQNQIKYPQFIKDPVRYFHDQNLVVKIDQSIYTWEIGLAIITCKMAFGRKLSIDHINDIYDKKRGSWLNIFSYKQKKFIFQTQEKDLQLKKLNSDFRQDKLKEEQFIFKYSRTPTQQDLQDLNLRQGMNTAKFVVSDNKRQLQLQCRIFLWNYKTKIIVSDIDGTITKTDVFGQMMPMFDQMWIHKGIVKFFDELNKRGYQIIYLTARAIVQYNQTRQFLFTQLKQDQFKAPIGPVFTSPKGLFQSFKVQMIDKQPDFLKTQILTAIKQNFPVNVRHSVLVAGFGNKMSDATAYKNAGIKKQNIFIIGENSVIESIVDKSFKSSYPSLLAKINEFFPDIKKIDAEMQKVDKIEEEEKKQKKTTEQISISQNTITELYFREDRLNSNQ